MRTRRSCQIGESCPAGRVQDRRTSAAPFNQRSGALEVAHALNGRRRFETVLDLEYFETLLHLCGHQHIRIGRVSDAAMHSECFSRCLKGL